MKKSSMENRYQQYINESAFQKARRAPFLKTYKIGREKIITLKIHLLHKTVGSVLGKYWSIFLNDPSFMIWPNPSHLN